MKKAILVSTARCNGKGTDRYKSISGITRSVIAECRRIDPDASILVPSHTEYLGQPYKLAVDQKKYGWTHRQIDCSEYKIINTI